MGQSAIIQHFLARNFSRRLSARHSILRTRRRICWCSWSKAYATTLGRSLDTITRWVEKTPANRNHISAILTRFPHAKILVTLRDPRAILAAQIALEKTRQTGRFSTYYVIAHWRVAAKLAKRIRDGEVPGFVVPYEILVREPARTMEEVCAYLDIDFDPDTVLTPTKVGRFWSGNSAARINFSQISTEPVTRWERELSQDEIGWVEWHCGDLMPELGYRAETEPTRIALLCLGQFAASARESM